MPQRLPDKFKEKGFKRIILSIKHSIDGICYIYNNERSMILHVFVSIVTISLGIIFRINLKEWGLLIIALLLILSMELLNTAIERTVDLVTKKVNPLAKIAKDCGSAASFVMCFISLIIFLFIFIPYVTRIIN